MESSVPSASKIPWRTSTFWLSLCSVRNIYAVSKPLLGLVLLNENQFFTEIKQQLLFGHTQAKQVVLSAALDNLMTGIDRTLTQINKEHFTQNITKFRSDIQDSLRGMMINNNELPSALSSMPLSSSFLSSASSIATNVPVTIAISTLIPSTSSSSTVAVEELMTLWCRWATVLFFCNSLFCRSCSYTYFFINLPDICRGRETRAPYLSICFFTFFSHLVVIIWRCIRFGVLRPTPITIPNTGRPIFHSNNNNRRRSTSSSTTVRRSRRNTTRVGQRNPRTSMISICPRRRHWIITVSNRRTHRVVTMNPCLCTVHLAHFKIP